MKARNFLILGLIVLVIVQYFSKRFEFTSGYTSFLRDLLEYNEFIGLTFYILSTSVLLYFLYKFYKLLKNDYENAGSIDHTYLENKVKQKR